MKKPLNKEYAIRRCFGYGRVSTDEQANRENNSIETQEKFIDRAIGMKELEGWTKVRMLTDPGYSAKDLNRPAMKELMQLVEDGEVDVILVYKLDRLTRSIRDFYDLWAIFEKHGVEVVSATEQIDTSTAMGRVVLNVILTFAQFEREMTSQRLQDKFAEEARAGMKHPGLEPYGYDLDRKNRSLLPNSEEATLTKLFYQWMTELRSPAAVARMANAKGARTKQRIHFKGTEMQRSVGGKKWTAAAMKRLIEQPLYKGVRVSASGEEYPARWVPLVSEKVWKDANEALENRDLAQQAKTVRNKHELALKGLLHCGHCGCAMSPKPGGKKDSHGGKRLYYSCQEVIRLGSQCDCDVRNLPGGEFDDFIVYCIGELGKHPDVIRATLESTAKAQKQSLRPLKLALADASKRLKELDGEIGNCLQVATKKGAAGFAAELLKKADSLSIEKRAVEQQRDKLAAEIDFRNRGCSDEALVAEALLNFEALFKALDFEDRIGLMEQLIRKVTVSRIVPEKLAELGVPQSYVTKIRTRYYKVDFDFFVTSLFRTASNSKASCSESSHLKLSGGERGIRTLGTV